MRLLGISSFIDCRLKENNLRRLNFDVSPPPPPPPLKSGRNGSEWKPENEKLREDKVKIEGLQMRRCRYVTDEHWNQTFAALCCCQCQKLCNVIDPAQ